WDPRNQRPELWNLFNTRIRRGETMRVFALSNWTELDVWEYIMREKIPVVPLYFAEPRPVVHRNGTLVMLDDDRLPLFPDEVPQMRTVRFRTLGCYPLTGAIESTAATVEAVLAELRSAKFSERQGRLIDGDEAASMEKKKRDGYF
ncbi:MAG: sulfate adenylyltransferase subunit CysD, partial [Bradyrhizobium sp.]|uniref:sulfate adenylyltransferase subunit CysD n=1 Tax=Bradyrhizobium sp. TaxID=376 RepID=UPI001D391E72